ncbi:MAG: hypothetical protein FWC42_06590 [Proteobacteria bacterium]|nr:hypothetical protein [Pseudomonadota bacterium]
MKPPTHSPSPTAMNDMDDVELLQAARGMQQPALAPALDAAILNAAAQRAAEVRTARATVASASLSAPKALNVRSAFDRFSHWLLGSSSGHGHLGQMVAAGIFLGVALGLILQANRENIFSPPPSENTVAMANPELSVAMPEKTTSPVEEKAAEAEPPRQVSTVPATSTTPAPAPMLEVKKTEAATSVAIPDASLDATSRARMPSASETRPQAGIAEEAQPAAASPPPQEALQTSPKPTPIPAPAPSPVSAKPAPAPVLADRMDAAVAPASPPPAEALAMPPVGAGASPAQGATKNEAAKEKEAEIDAQLRHVLDLRRAGKEEEAQLLLRQLRARHPDIDIDERLRQREENEKDKK